jgi:hypothetical protein
MRNPTRINQSSFTAKNTEVTTSVTKKTHQAAHHLAFISKPLSKACFEIIK